MSTRPLAQLEMIFSVSLLASACGSSAGRDDIGQADDRAALRDAVVVGLDAWNDLGDGGNSFADVQADLSTVPRADALDPTDIVDAIVMIDASVREWRPLGGYGVHSSPLRGACAWSPTATQCWGDLRTLAGQLPLDGTPVEVPGVRSVTAMTGRHSVILGLRLGESGIGSTESDSLNEVFLDPLPDAGGRDSGFFFSQFSSTRRLDGAASVSVDGVAALIADERGHVNGLGSTSAPVWWPLGTLAQPTRINDLEEVVQVSLSQTHACALRRDGTVWCWGSNNRGQLGFPHCELEEDRRAGCIVERPVQVPNQTNVAEVVVGSAYTCVRRTRGVVYCWGDAREGVLGVPEPVVRECIYRAPTLQPYAQGHCTYEPVLVPRITHAVRLLMNGNVPSVIQADGSLWSWSYLRGEADQPGVPGPNPAPMAGVFDVVDYSYPCVLQRDHAVLCWGLNDWGQLGLGTRDDRSHPPTRVPLPAGW